MNPILDLWRKLDHYLIRHHAGLWLLHIHRLHAGSLIVTVFLALVVFLLPWDNLLEIAFWLKFFVIIALGMLFYGLPVMLTSEGPFVRHSRWPHSLCVWYCLFVVAVPAIILPSMMRTRAEQHVLNSRNAARWSYILESYSSDMSSWEDHCRREMDAPDIIDPEPVKRICSLLSPSLVPSPFQFVFKHTDWLSFLLLLLLLAQRTLFLGSSVSDSFLAGSAVVFVTVLTPFIGFFIVAVSPLPTLSSWIITGTITVLVLCLLVHIARAHRMTPSVVWSWSVILAGVPLLTIVGSFLLKPMEVHYQVLYLGPVLLLAYWLERLHDRLYALPE